MKGDPCNEVRFKCQQEYGRENEGLGSDGRSEGVKEVAGSPVPGGPGPGGCTGGGGEGPAPASRAG